MYHIVIKTTRPVGMQDALNIIAAMPAPHRANLAHLKGCAWSVYDDDLEAVQERAMALLHFLRIVHRYEADIKED